MTRSFPLRRSLVVRLTAVSLLIALGSIAATAWLAVQTTTRAIQQEQGQALSGDATIYTEVLGFAAANHTWDQVGPKLKALSDQTGRRIVLTTLDRRVLGDSGGAPVTLPVKATASVDPLHVDPVLLPQAGTSGIDPRAVGPYRLPAAEHSDLDGLARKVASCLTDLGFPSQVRDAASGRPQLTGLDPLAARYFAAKCGVYDLAEATPTEAAALAKLNDAVNSCLEAQKQPPVKLGLDFEALGETDQRRSQGCVDSARRAQLTPYVAPPALLFTLGPGGSQLPTFTLSKENLTRILAVTGGVLVLAAAITVLVARRLSRPLRALTEAAQQDRPAPVKSRDEVGYLAAAFNDLTARRERIEEQRKAMVSDIAHELRNPLNVIRGRLEAAEDGHLPFDRALTTSLLEETVLLQHIVEDLQDLAAADAGRLRLHPEPVDAAELAGHVACRARRPRGRGRRHAHRLGARRHRADGRSSAAAPGRLQPGDQRGPAHAARRPRDDPRFVHCGRSGDRRGGHRRRDRGRGPPARVRAVLAGREVAQPPDRRQRARPRHRAAPRAGTRRHGDREVRSGHRVDVHRPATEDGSPW